MLQAAGHGDRIAADRLLPLVYDELRRLAGSQLRAENSGHTLQATALAHEAYLRLIDQTRVSWAGRAHFMAVAAEMIRRILVDHARARSTLKRGGGVQVVALDAEHVAGAAPSFDVLDLHDALEALTALSERQARVIELKFFGGLETREIAEAMGISETLVKNEWRFARAWLASRLGRVPGS